MENKGWYRCPLCGRKYLADKQLQEHFRRSPVCKDWADMKLYEHGLHEVQHAKQN
jgi:serine acetyltransferase